MCWICPPFCLTQFAAAAAAAAAAMSERIHEMLELREPPWRFCRNCCQEYKNELADTILRLNSSPSFEDSIPAIHISGGVSVYEAVCTE
jgi:hypothetical protein